MPRRKTAQAAPTTTDDPIDVLRAAGALGQFAADGRRWETTFVRHGSGPHGTWDLRITSLDEAIPVTMAIGGPDTDFASATLERLKSDPEFRRAHLPRRKSVHDGNYYHRKVYVEYKGKKYRLLWAGPTEHGAKIKLEFMNGSKQFWADGDAVTPSDAPPAAPRHPGGPRRVECIECGAWIDEGGVCTECAGI